MAAAAADLLAAHCGGFEVFVSGEMATEVETLPPSNPLLEPEPEGRQAERDGGYLLKEQSLSPRCEEDASRTEITEAPPPKVNPWTKKMSAVNGQTPHGQ